MLRVDPWVEKIPWRRKWQPVFLPGKSHGGLQSTGSQESITTERSLLLIQELFPLLPSFLGWMVNMVAFGVESCENEM